MCCAQARDKYCIERHQRATSNTTQSMHEENMTINQAGRRIGCRHNILSTPTPMLAPVLILGTVGRAHGQTLCRFFYLKSSVVQKIKSESKSAHVLFSKGGMELCHLFGKVCNFSSSCLAHSPVGLFSASTQTASTTSGLSTQHVCDPHLERLLNAINGQRGRTTWQSVLSLLLAYPSQIRL